MKIQFDIYKEDDRWFFDDPGKNIVHEEFVSNVPSMLLTLIKDPEKKRIQLEVYNVFLFDADAVLEHIEDINESNTSGVWYKMKGIKGWFCPVFWRYFKTAPDTLWIRILNIQ